MPRDVNRLAHPPHERLRERGAPPGDLIEIPARHGVVARVKSVRHDGRRQDVDVRRQLVVQAPPERLGRQRRADVEVRHLRQRVNAGIGAARAVKLEVLAAGDASRRAIDFALNRSRVLLDLPAAVTRAGVLDGQLEARHRWILRAGRAGEAGRAGTADCSEGLRTGTAGYRSAHPAHPARPAHYSARSARIGSIVAARRAGARHASAATTASVMATAT